MGMEMRYWTENGNGMGVGIILREWKGMRTTTVIPAHLYRILQQEERDFKSLWSIKSTKYG